MTTTADGNLITFSKRPIFADPQMRPFQQHDFFNLGTYRNRVIQTRVSRDTKTPKTRLRKTYDKEHGQPNSILSENQTKNVFAEPRFICKSQRQNQPLFKNNVSKIKFNFATTYNLVEKGVIKNVFRFVIRKTISLPRKTYFISTFYPF